MPEDPVEQAVDLPEGAAESSSPPSELRFDGAPARNGAVLGEKQLGKEGRQDPRVQALAGARYKAMSPARLPISRSPRLTIPPGFSPSALLESPVLLTNIKAEPSPTTGTFSVPSMTKGSVGSAALSSPREKSLSSMYGEDHSGSFEFRPNIRMGLSSLSALASAGSKQQEHATSTQVQSLCVTQTLPCPQLVKTENTAASLCEPGLTVKAVDPPVEIVAAKPITSSEVGCDVLQETRGSDNGVTTLPPTTLLPDNNGSTSVLGDKISDDGYNWRKYGQKHVKGSEFPRSYYKCTHPNCQMKKQLERSHDGQITEVIYKGRHDHPKPQPSRRLAVGAILSSQGEERSDGISLLNPEDKPSNTHGQTSHQIDANGNPDLSPMSVSDDDLEAGGGRLNHIGDEAADGDDPESKRRKMDTGVTDATQIGKVNREPRVVVQTVSEVDILDDGYRWRKYGQKVVKGNPNPRSYYKCTNAGCPVRKHVERASHDPRAVITTYEGKHNHDVPASRNSSHDTTSSSVGDGSNTLNAHMSVTLNSMMRSCDMRVIPHHHYNLPDDRDTISLDLGVGISPRHKSSNEKQQASEIEQAQNHQLHFAATTSGQANMYANANHRFYGSIEEKADGFTFSTAAISHASNPFYSNAGNLVMGP